MFARVEGFIRSRNGGVALMFGLIAMLLIGFIGFSIDYTRAHRIRSNAQTAIDAAALAAARARMTSNVDPVVVARDYFNSNFVAKNDVYASQLTAQVDEAQKIITVATNTRMSNAFARVLGVDWFDIALTAQAAFGTSPAELVLVVDNTASMAGTKLDGLKAAAKGLVDTIYSEPGSDTQVKVGIVPFAQYVNVGLLSRNASWLDVPPDTASTSYQCWDTYPSAVSSNCQPVTTTCYQDGVPSSCTYTSCDWDYGNPVQVCADVTTTNTWYGCVGSRNYPLDVNTAANFSSARVPGVLNSLCTAELTRLTNDRARLDSQLDALTAIGDTYIQPGLIWGWRVLDWNEPFADGSNPAGNKDVKKYMILMTDGANTQSPIYPTHTGADATLANQLTQETCTNIKAAGVTIFTVAFEVTDPVISGVLKDCASGPPYHYSAENTTDLSVAFQDIAKSISVIRIVR